ncbi:hypothetical protein [Actinomyces viscosus]|uniref:LppU/SCO3897 family protein n=1 Tax=Actinomyces viscosus TaxID=1656 RepID=UPI0028E41EF8|nr:hypothetical protein [Actinomyces viscosus]
MITGLGLGIRWLIVSSSIENAKTGHCLAQVVTSSHDPVIVSCGSAKAEFKVTGRVSQPEKCLPIPGTTSVYDTGEDYLCLTDPDSKTDPQHAVNGVQAGDCVAVNDKANLEKEAVITDCAASGTYPVLAVLKDVSVSSRDQGAYDHYAELCMKAGTTEPDTVYQFHMRRLPSNGGRYSSSIEADIALCLGPQN